MIIKTGTFLEQTENNAVIHYGVFGDTARNIGTVEVSAVFNDTSTNIGTVSSTALFTGSAVNTGTVRVAYFSDFSVNSGTVFGNAYFSPNATNVGTVTGNVGIYPLVDGMYSFGYVINGFEDLNYTNNTPQTAVDIPNGYFVCTTGNATSADGGYSNGYYLSGIRDTNGLYASLQPETVIDNSLWYSFVSGYAIKASGFYSNYYFTTGGQVDVGYSVSTPQQAQNNGLYYTYFNGSAIVASGPYSIGYYSSGSLDDSYTNLTAQSALDDRFLYTYNNGLATPYEPPTEPPTNPPTEPPTTPPNPLNGAYSIGYYSNNQIDTNYTNNIPQSAQDDNLYYSYLSGAATIGDGVYSVFCLSAGSIITDYTSYTPQSAIDNELYYLYNNGTPVLADYPWQTGSIVKFSNGYFVNGTFDETYTDLIPSTVTDDSSYYTFLSGRTTIADGAYSNYYFLTGSIDITYTNTTPQTAINNELYYTYNSGSAIQRSFILKDDFNQPHTFYCDGELVVGKVLYTNIELTNSASLIEGWKVDINLDNILDAIWTSTSNTGVIEETRFGNSIALSGSPYFYISPYQYLNNLINLYTDSSMSIPASGLDIVADFNNDGFDDHLTTDEFGTINLTISTVLSGVRYYYSADSDMLDNFIQLFTDAELTIPAADLDIAGDFNNDSVEDQLTTDSNGYVSVTYG